MSVNKSGIGTTKDVNKMKLWLPLEGLIILHVNVCVYCINIYKALLFDYNNLRVIVYTEDVTQVMMNVKNWNTM